MCQVSPDILENENEGTLAVTVVAPRLSDSQLLHLISSYGHVRSFQADTDRWPLFAIVEYYDTRHAISAKMILQELRNKNQIQCQVSFYQKDRIATLKSGRLVEQHLQYGLQDEPHRSPSSLDVLMAASRWLAAPEAIQRVDCTSVSPTESNSSSGPFQHGIESLPIFSSPPDIIRGPQSPTSTSESHVREASTEIHKKIAPSTLSAGMVQDDAQERTKCQGIRSTEAVHDLSYASAVAPVTADPQVNKLTMTTAADKRTTFMIRNIPNKYTQQMLLECINETHFAMFDFLYLRMDFKNKCNVGYAFINFINTDVVSSFIKERVGKKWSRFNSDKICSLSYATIQGRSALVEKFRNSSVMNEEPSYRPKIFYVGGPNIGKEEPFPEPTVAKEGSQHNSRRRGPHGRVADY
ncbi:hypothetical protein BGZ98_001308 [Dissophora globulifera]|nr:hypothetical protein BGZ98_001308 [Dissophora globulifera]